MSHSAVYNPKRIKYCNQKSLAISRRRGQSLGNSAARTSSGEENTDPNTTASDLHRGTWIAIYLAFKTGNHSDVFGCGVDLGDEILHFYPHPPAWKTLWIFGGYFLSYFSKENRLKFVTPKTSETFTTFPRQGKKFITWNSLWGRLHVTNSAKSWVFAADDLGFLGPGCRTSWQSSGRPKTLPLKTLTSLNKEVRPFFPSDISIWSLPSVSSVSDYSIWRSWRLFYPCDHSIWSFGSVVPKY